MSPNGADARTKYHPTEVLTKLHNADTKEEANKIWYKKYELRRTMIIMQILLFITTPYILVTFPYIEKYKTVLWAVFAFMFSMFGTTAGVHRLWTHKSFQAKLPLQILLAVAYLSNLQAPIRSWVRIHRAHHKHSDTDGDPHNSRNGLFYSHIGWLLIKTPRNVSDKYKTLDMKDVNENPVISFFDRHFWTYSLIITAMITAIPVYCWHEEWYYVSISQLARFVLGYNVTLSVNSLAHAFGDKPFNRYIPSTDNSFVSYVTLGEGWHNYHHTFPYDYRTPEFIGLRFDLTAKTIEFFEKIGWAYDLRRPNEEHVKRAIKNKGDSLLQPLVD